MKKPPYKQGRGEEKKRKGGRLEFQQRGKAEPLLVCKVVYFHARPEGGEESSEKKARLRLEKSGGNSVILHGRNRDAVLGGRLQNRERSELSTGGYGRRKRKKIRALAPGGKATNFRGGDLTRRPKRAKEKSARRKKDAHVFKKMITFPVESRAHGKSNSACPWKKKARPCEGPEHLKKNFGSENDSKKRRNCKEKEDEGTSCPERQASGVRTGLRASATSVPEKKGRAA